MRCHSLRRPRLSSCRARAIVLASAAALVVGGCGGDSDGGDSEAFKVGDCLHVGESRISPDPPEKTDCNDGTAQYKVEEVIDETKKCGQDAEGFPRQALKDPNAEGKQLCVVDAAR